MERNLIYIIDAIRDVWWSIARKIQPDGDRYALRRKLWWAFLAIYALISLYAYGAGYSLAGVKGVEEPIVFGFLIAVIWPFILAGVILYYPLIALHTFAVWLAS